MQLNLNLPSEENDCTTENLPQENKNWELMARISTRPRQLALDHAIAQHYYVQNT